MTAADFLNENNLKFQFIPILILLQGINDKFCGFSLNFHFTGSRENPAQNAASSACVRSRFAVKIYDGTSVNPPVNPVQPSACAVRQAGFPRSVDERQSAGTQDIPFRTGFQQRKVETVGKGRVEVDDVKAFLCAF